MSTARLLGVVLLAAAGGCGPHLAAPDADVGSVGGTGGDGGGWTSDADAGGSTGPAIYNWGDVAVRVVQATSTAASGLFFRMTDETGASTLSAALQFSPLTRVAFPSDGAFIAAHYDCSGPNLYRLGLYSCPGQNPSDELANGPGCLAVVFTAQGARGNFITATGASCTIESATATASIDLPQTEVVGPPGVASGRFTLECAGGEKTRLKLEGVFAVPVVQIFLTC